MATTLFLIALFGLFAWVSWKYLPMEWAKYLVGGVFLLLALYELLCLAFGVLGGPTPLPAWHRY